MALQFVDRYSSTLASSYTSGGGSLSVSSATLLPSDGTCDFYLIVKAEGSNTEEVFHVTSKTGTALTVTGAQANTTASNHASGAIVIGTMMTKTAYNQMRADMIAGPYITDGNSNYYVPPTMSLATLPSLATFAWVNQGGAAETSDNGSLVLHAPANSGLSVRIRKKSISTDTSLIACVRVTAVAKNYAAGGVVFRESGTSKLAVFQGAAFADGGVTLSINYDTNETNYSSTPFSMGTINCDTIWLKLAISGSNLLYSASFDGGSNFVQVLSAAKTAAFTTAPDEWGYFCDAENASYDAYTRLLSWKTA